MILFTSFLNPVSKNGLALAFHVKSMRVAQFIKLDGRAPNGEFLDPAPPSQIGETKKGSWHKASPIPWQHWWMTFLSPLPPRARVQYVQNLLIYPTISFTIICFCKECMKGDYDGFMLSGCWPAVTRCVSCISLAAASRDMTTCSAWIEYSEYNQLIGCSSEVSWTPG